MARRLTDMVVVITGASAGIGRALAIALSAAGAKVALTARRLDRLEALNASLGGRHLCIAADVARTEDCEMLIDKANRHFGRIDTLVCNAGYAVIRTVADTSAQQMREIFQTNVFGTTDTIHAAVPLMRRQEPRDGYRGQVMIVSSAAGRRGLPFFGAYSATKFAQLGLAEALRVELRPDAIAVSSVHPIGTNTDFFTTAEARSCRRMPPPAPGELHQSPETVARSMIAAIRKPKPEVWPFRPVRIGLSLSTLVPRLTDRVLVRYCAQFKDDHTGSLPNAVPNTDRS